MDGYETLTELVQATELARLRAALAEIEAELRRRGDSHVADSRALEAVSHHARAAMHGGIAVGLLQAAALLRTALAAPPS